MTRLLVLGAGVSGQAAARLAIARGMSVTVFDEAVDVPIVPGAGMATGGWDALLLNGVDVVVASPGFSVRSTPVVEAIESGLPVWSEIEFASQHLRVPMAAVTGTNGKTTVTEAAAAMLDASGVQAPATGNIGAPLSDFVESDADVLVVEVSSFQLKFIESFHPRAACITNVAVDHLDWHGSPQAYREAKARIFENQGPEDLLAYDADDPGASSVVEGASSRLLPVSGLRLPESGAGVSDRRLVIGDAAIDIADLSSDDPAHLVDIALAGAIALHMGATPQGVAATAAEYRPGAHRRELVAESGGVRWVNDSKATNPHAAIASIRSHGSVILIAGGLAKGIDLSGIAAEPNVKLLLGIGSSGESLAEEAGERGRYAGTLEIAVEMADRAAQPGDTVLLAPGCASFDQFTSYGARGDRFVELIDERHGVRRR